MTEPTSLLGDPEPADPGRVGAVVLAGGTAARLGGADKASIELAGVTLLERALSATVTAVEVVVVGDPVPTTRPATFTVEDPRGGGPAAGLLAGLRAFYREPDLVLVLAVDMPRVGPGTFARLLGAVVTPGRDGGPDGALLVGDGGRRQPLCAAYRTAALRRVAPESREDEHGLPVHRLVGALDLVEVAEVADESHDVDTWSDLRELREQAERT
ncbi:NTP transferase domain-containing protein [Nocardioides sp. HDW12B]|uniref:molybdenum cofactor guanylyltransferase n=1 Tax=Nocardioides sp. HDW12B TaxID=2714939 RepID=UPI001409FA7D|nr:NTP transferase domain-containing protein [Nocardioides sp. HDW12B]QIK68079.1 NTP transferase domain-containing protein [Nocardioides sp. HDW12B]